MGERLGIIAGSGEIPFAVAAEARRKGFDVFIAAVRGEADPRIGEGAAAVEWLDPMDAVGLLSFLKSHDIGSVLMAGKVRPDAAVRNPDRAAGGSPSRLIGKLIALLESRGVRVEDPTPFLAGAFPPPGVLTKAPLETGILEDAEYGFGIARVLADLDVGQTLAVRNRMIVAVEGMEGTDRAILRAGELAGPGTVVVKVGRSGQDPRIDLPAAGFETVRSLVRARASAFAFEAGRVAFFGGAEVIALAEANGIALLSIEPPGVPGGPRRQL
jgi:UDP-2,3-diacylglucosamine hydrolase